jgi:hypothetical protein
MDEDSVTMDDGVSMIMDTESSVIGYDHTCDDFSLRSAVGLNESASSPVAPSFSNISGILARVYIMLIRYILLWMMKSIQFLAC